MARPLRSQLIMAVLAGAASTGCAVALLATSGFLLARAAEHPNIVAISVAVVAVRGLSVGRGVFRYGERLSSHDAAFRVLADVRVRVYQRLERLAPAGLREFRSGDLLARLVSDVDATQDLFIRGIVPPLTAFLVGAGAATACLIILAPAGAVLAAGLLVAGLAVSWLAAARGRRAARRTAPARGALSARVTDLLAGAADLHAFGAQDAALARADTADAELTRLARTSAAGAALGSGLSQAVAGVTLWGVLVLGVAAVGSGSMSRVPLAVITLTALAAFEAVTALPAAAIALGHARTSAARVVAVLDAPDPVPGPATPRPLPGGPLRVRLRGVCVRYEPDGPLALDGVDSKNVADVVGTPRIVRRVNRQVLSHQQTRHRGGHQYSVQDAHVKTGNVIGFVTAGRRPTLGKTQYQRQHRQDDEFNDNQLRPRRAGGHSAVWNCHRLGNGFIHAA